MGATIIIPAYNAASTLPAVLRRLWAATERDLVERIWIVDDGSSDDTATTALSLAKRDKRITLRSLPQNRGYGGAVKVGLTEAIRQGASEVVCLHADGQYAPEEIPAMLQSLRDRQLDLLQGSRIASGTGLSGGMPLYKYVAGRILTVMENHVFGLQLTDYHSGYLVYGRRALRVTFAQLSDSFDFDLEVIASARALGLRIGEHPIPTHYGDEVSYLDPINYGLRVLRVMVDYRRGRYHRRRIEQ